MERQRSGLLLFYLVLLGVVVALLGKTLVDGVMGETVAWTEAKQLVREGRIKSAIFDDTFVTLEPVPVDGTEQQPLRTVIVKGDDSFAQLLEEKGVSYQQRPSTGCEGGGAAALLIPIAAVALMFMLFARRDAGAPPGVATFGKSSAKLAPEEGTGVTFRDVAGIDEAKEELEEIVQFLRTPERFTALGGKIPKGVLLVGPPGTGKTLLARAVAGEAGVPFFSISGSDFVEMFVGVGAARVRDLFQNAAKHAPCIIFIDELDAIGKARGGPSPVGGHDEREQTLNQLLVEMDGFDGRKGIIIMAATNRPETLDPALLRAGRFDRQVLVDRPDVRGRKAILEIHSREIKLAPGLDMEVVAKMTPGFAGADLANVLNEAALLAARRGKGMVDLKDIEDAIERTVAGLERKNRRISPAEKRVVAYHEAGHAICAAASPGADPVSKISIIPRGIGALGYTLQMPEEDRYLMTRTELLGRLVVLYGGRVAEELVFHEITTGASDDIRKASDLARRMITQYGMSEAMGAIDYGGTQQNPFGFQGGTREIPLSEATAQRIDAEVRQVLDRAHEQATAILQHHTALLERMAEHLLEHEVLDRDAVKGFLEDVPAWDPTPTTSRPAEVAHT